MPALVTTAASNDRTSQAFDRTAICRILGRLAVDQSFQGKGIGSALLADASARSIGNAVAAFALLVDAKSDQAVAFYERHGFLRFESQPRTLFLPLATAEKVLRRPRGG